MTQHWAMFLMLLACKLILGQGKERSWTWSWPSHQLTDEEIVDLLYTDPDRLRALTYDGYEASYDYEIPQTLDYRPLETVPEIPQRPGIYEEEGIDSNGYSEPPATAKPQATSFMRFQHYSPKTDSKIVSYSHRIVH